MVKLWGLLGCLGGGGAVGIGRVVQVGGTVGMGRACEWEGLVPGVTVGPATAADQLGECDLHLTL